MKNPTTTTDDDACQMASPDGLQESKGRIKACGFYPTSSLDRFLNGASKQSLLNSNVPKLDSEDRRHNNVQSVNFNLRNRRMD